MRSLASLSLLAMVAVLGATPAPAADAVTASAIRPLRAADASTRACRSQRDDARLLTALAPRRTQTSPGTAGLRIGIDPVSGRPAYGQVEPRTEMDAAHELSLDRSAQGLTIVRHADGSESVDLGERFMEYAVIRIDANGVKQVGCVSSVADAQRVSRPLAPTSRKGK